MLSCLIYLALTLVVPIRLTHSSIKSGEALGARLWSSYWAFYCFILLIKSVFTFLTYQPFEFAILLFHLWLYTEQYRGALLLNNLIVKKLEELKFDTHVKQAGERLSFLNILENDKKQEKGEYKKQN